MKLIYCPKCQDVVKLLYDKRSCSCGAAWGQYEKDGIHATVGGVAIPIGLHNRTLAEAVSTGSGDLIAWIIEFPCATVKREEDADQGR